MSIREIITNNQSTLIDVASADIDHLVDICEVTKIKVHNNVLNRGYTPVLKNNISSATEVILLDLSHLTSNPNNIYKLLSLIDEFPEKKINVIYNDSTIPLSKIKLPDTFDVISYK